MLVIFYIIDTKEGLGDFKVSKIVSDPGGGEERRTDIILITGATGAAGADWGEERRWLLQFLILDWQYWEGQEAGRDNFPTRYPVLPLQLGHGHAVVLINLLKQYLRPSWGCGLGSIHQVDKILSNVKGASVFNRSSSVGNINWTTSPSTPPSPSSSLGTAKAGLSPSNSHQTWGSRQKTSWLLSSRRHQESRNFGSEKAERPSVPSPVWWKLQCWIWTSWLRTDQVTSSV